jgi:diguanylate cyclase (GGDEF)-like protein
MDEALRKETKARGVLLATGGLATALALMLGMKALGLTQLTYEGWAWCVMATAAVQGTLLLVATRGLDRRIPGDRHYLYTPLLGAMLLLALYMYLAPELRFMFLLGWYVALLFMTGLGGARAVVWLSTIMAVGYFVVASALQWSGYPLSLAYEAAMAASVVVISLYAGLVFERLRADRTEMRAMRKRLAAMALTDALTQLPNRRHFEKVLRAELDRVRRYGGRCSLGMVDVDSFKHYNDTVGHLAGDTVLRELAHVMRRELRVHDMVARLGGEEFALIMINAGKDGARPIVERLRADVERHPFRHRDLQPHGRLTVSIGLATFPDDGANYEDLLKQADDALYRAKREGRNRVCEAGAVGAPRRHHDRA